MPTSCSRLGCSPLGDAEHDRHDGAHRGDRRDDAHGPGGQRRVVRRPGRPRRTARPRPPRARSPVERSPVPGDQRHERDGQQAERLRPGDHGVRRPGAGQQAAQEVRAPPQRRSTPERGGRPFGNPRATDRRDPARRAAPGHPARPTLPQVAQRQAPVTRRRRSSGRSTQVHAARVRPEIVLTEVAPPARIAPYAVALTADVMAGAGGDDEELATGRFVLLHDPDRARALAGHVPRGDVRPGRARAGDGRRPDARRGRLDLADRRAGRPRRRAHRGRAAR